MTFADSIKTCFTKYVGFEGRASRSEFWWFYLVSFIASCIPCVGWILGLGMLIPVIAAGVRRIHDHGKCGWWVICPIYNIILWATAGTGQPNEYGPVPES